MAVDGESHDVGLDLKAEGSLVGVGTMVLKSSSSDPDKLTLAEIAVFLIQNLAEPELIAIVDDSNLAGVVIDLEELSDLDLEIELVELPVFAPSAEFGNIFKFCDIFLAQNSVFSKGLSDPITVLGNQFLL